MENRGINASPEEITKNRKERDTWDHRINSISHMFGAISSDMAFGGFKLGSTIAGKTLQWGRANGVLKAQKIGSELVKNAVWADKTQKPLRRSLEFLKHYTNPKIFKTVIRDVDGVIHPSLYQTMGNPIDHPITLAAGGVASYLMSLDPTMNMEKVKDKAQSMFMLGAFNSAFGMALGQFARMAGPVIRPIANKLLDPVISQAIVKDISQIGYFGGTFIAMPSAVLLEDFLHTGGINITWNGLTQSVIENALYSFGHGSKLISSGRKIFEEYGYRKANLLVPVIKDLNVPEDKENITAFTQKEMREPTIYEFFRNRVTELGRNPDKMILAYAVNIIGTDEKAINSFLRKTNKLDTKEAIDYMINTLRYVKEKKGNVPIIGAKLDKDEQGNQIFAQYDLKSNAVLLSHNEDAQYQNRQLNNMDNMLSFVLHEGEHALEANEYDTNKDFRITVNDNWSKIKELVEDDDNLQNEILMNKDLFYPFAESGLIEMNNRSVQHNQKEFLALLSDPGMTEFRNKLQDMKIESEDISVSQKLINGIK